MLASSNNMWVFFVPERTDRPTIMQMGGLFYMALHVPRRRDLPIMICLRRGGPPNVQAFLTLCTFAEQISMQEMCDHPVIIACKSEGPAPSTLSLESRVCLPHIASCGRPCTPHNTDRPTIMFSQMGWATPANPPPASLQPPACFPSSYVCQRERQNGLAPTRPLHFRPRTKDSEFQGTTLTSPTLLGNRRNQSCADPAPKRAPANEQRFFFTVDQL